MAVFVSLSHCGEGCGGREREAARDAEAGREGERQGEREGERQGMLRGEMAPRARTTFRREVRA